MQSICWRDCANPSSNASSRTCCGESPDQLYWKIWRQTGPRILPVHAAAFVRRSQFKNKNPNSRILSYSIGWSQTVLSPDNSCCPIPYPICLYAQKSKSCNIRSDILACIPTTRSVNLGIRFQRLRRVDTVMTREIHQFRSHRVLFRSLERDRVRCADSGS